MIGSVEGSRRITPLILKVAARLCSAVNTKLRPHYPGKETDTSCTRVWMGATASVRGCGEEKNTCPHRGYKPGPPISQRVFKSNTLSLPHHPCRIRNPLFFQYFFQHRPSSWLSYVCFIIHYCTNYFHLPTVRVMVIKMPPVFTGSKIT